MIAATIASAIACIVLVAAEWRRWRGVRIAAKAFASLGFVTVAVVAVVHGTLELHGWPDYQRYLVIGLVLGVIGDISLLGSGSRAFLAGLGAFLLGHVAYIVACGQLVSPEQWLELAGWYAVLPIAVGLGALALLWRSLGSMRFPVIGYVVAIITMMIAAIAASQLASIPQPNRGLLLVGSALFFASDLAVARERFVVSALSNKTLGLPAYYAGQLLIAWSLIS